MSNHSLGYLIRNFSRVEHKRISDFLSIPTFGSQLKHQLLFDMIAKGSSNDDLTDTKILKSIFNKSNVRPVEIRLLKSELKKLIEKYIALKHFSEDEITMNLSILDYYHREELHKLYSAKEKNIEQKLTKTLNRDAAYYRNKFQFELIRVEYQLSQSRNQELNIQGILDNVDIAYYAEKLKQVCVALSHHAVYQQTYQYGILPTILKDIKQKKLTVIPSIGAYYHCYYMLTENNNADHFLAFRKTISQHSTAFSKEELSSLYRLAINYCIRRLNIGEREFGSIGLELYKEAIDSGYFLQNGFLSRFTYRNVAMIAIRLEQFEWAEQFSEQFYNRIRPVYKESAYHFNLALIHYSKKEYNLSMDALIQIRIKDPLINLGIKTLQGKIYYELQEWDVLSSHLDAMTVYIHRNKVLGYHKQNYLNIVKYLKRLLKLQYAPIAKLESLKTKIINEKHLTERKWMVQQLNTT